MAIGLDWQLSRNSQLGMEGGVADRGPRKRRDVDVRREDVEATDWTESRVDSTVVERTANGERRTMKR